MTRRKINRITLLLLAAGWGSALAIYLTAAPKFVDPVMGDPLDNKKYRHELAVYGGRANVMSAEFMDWFDDLWHGRRLAGTIFVLTAGTTLIFRFVATHPDNLVEEERRPPAGSPPPT